MLPSYIEPAVECSRDQLQSEAAAEPGLAAGV